MIHREPALTRGLIVLAISCFLAGGAMARDMELVDSVSFSVLVPAGESCSIAADCWENSLELTLPQEGLTVAAEAAVDLAPQWLKRDLRDNFRRLSEADQNTYAGLIVGAVAPFIDEICFQVAHIAPETLGGSLVPSLLVDNVETLYDIDTYLDYANIVDYDNGGDFYSTIVYSVMEGEDVFEYELPREQYYWFVVHPKLHKETPGYINPNTGYPANPPTGVFWRDYLMNHNDFGYPLLRSSLESCEVLWKNQQNNLDNGAVGALTQWVKDVMTFSSHTHHDQPVRIYDWHVGTCSVHSYLTSAASRAALIPAVVDVMYSDNHKINEFWERRWVAWEPVNTYIDNPGGYENWGWDVAAAFNWRGDSYIWDATSRYTETCTLDVTVTDLYGRPVDGARVKIYSSPCTGWGATAGWTNFDGEKQFLLGDSRTFYGSVYSDIGVYPPSGQTAIIVGSVAGGYYTWDVTLPGEVSGPDYSPGSPPGNPTEFHRLEVEFDLPEEILYGKNFDDLNHFSEPSAPGHIDFFICDDEQYALYLADQPFEAFEIALGASSAVVEFTLPNHQRWHAVFSNESNLVLTQDLQVDARFYTDATAVDDGEQAAAAAVSLYANYPNPFNPETRINFELVQAGNIELVVYTVRGEKVRTLIDEYRGAGSHSVTWDARDDAGRTLSSAVYLYRLRTEDGDQVRRMILAK